MVSSYEKEIKNFNPLLEKDVDEYGKVYIWILWLKTKTDLTWAQDQMYNKKNTLRLKMIFILLSVHP